MDAEFLDRARKEIRNLSTLIQFLLARNELIEIAAFDGYDDKAITEAEKKMRDIYAELPFQIQSLLDWDMEWAGKNDG